ncbi:hypothetical protein CC1G_04066 [Coprinopsis cinerea okayama7|uniref:F-box domain-containing protein n=1 Tax=Coprinopsis cinerea (strain Okayama-7 / 130 / ATCC MYA-4618 / FGSC 9003) TaxID=240176 RepID=A8NVT7_COPC7|nr:hypothetical protein CC1G_04066 [Coprinopsis cinerea okayama7\|eukprot:XP_001836753.1 hypothetical protein CC1G_04066 [Coprinopsis cinerea okayama7\
MSYLHNRDLAPYLACNAELPAHLHLSATAHLPTLHEQLRDARKRVDEIKEILAKAQRDVSAAEDRVENYQKLVSPIRKLPADLLAHIVLFTMPVSPNLPRLGVDYDPNSLERLRRVCKKWKNVMDSSPELWKRLWLDGTGMRPKIMARILRRWFSRAGEGGLGLVIVFPSNVYSGNYGDLVAFLRSKIWKGLAFHETSPEILEAVFNEDYNCSTLETLWVSWSRPRRDYKMPERHPLYQELPAFLQRFSRLKHLSIWWDVLDSIQKPELFKLPCLTDIELTGPMPEDYVRRLLLGLPSLKNAAIFAFDPGPRIESQDLDSQLSIERLTILEGRCQWFLKELPLLKALRLAGFWEQWSLLFIPTNPASIYRFTNLHLVCLDKLSIMKPEDIAFAVCHLPPSVRVVRVSSIELVGCITCRVAARKFVGRRLDIVVMELGEDMGSYEWETALKHLVKVFVKKRPGRAREAFRGRDLVIWIEASSWEECGYREEWNEWLALLRSVNVRFELTLGPRPGDDVEFDIPYV